MKNLAAESNESIRKAEERYRNFIEQSSEGIWCFELTNPVGTDLSEDEQIQQFYETSCLAECNDAMARMYGYSHAGELTGTPLYEILVPTEPSNIEYLRSFIRSGYKLLDAESFEFDQRGNRKYFLNNLVGVIEESRLVRVWGTQRDITKPKELEMQLLQAQKMEAIGRLAGGVAHDFNNLLTAIIGYSDVLLEKLDLEPDEREDLEEIKRAGDRAGALTRQLLAFSRRQILSPRVVDLNSVIKDLEKMLRRLIGEDIEIRTQCSPALGRVRVDPGQMEQVIMNLVLNARDAMPEGGTLTIETSEEGLGDGYASSPAGVSPGLYVVLSVIDTGMGMDAETQARIFEPFYTTKDLQKGTGLGLSTVYGIVNQSGGHIGIHSEQGQGSTFKIYLPRVEEAPDSIDAKPEADLPLQGSETVLLVEDEESVRKLSAGILKRYGYVTLVAASGEEALCLSREYGGEVHLLFTDVVMPRISGRDLASILKEERPGIRVLYTSGYPAEARVLGTLRPDSDLIPKPFTARILAIKIRELLDR